MAASPSAEHRQLPPPLRTGKYIGNRPCKLSRSNWDERNAPTKRKGREQGGGPQKKKG
jgi:hypothetical protein